MQPFAGPPYRTRCMNVIPLRPTVTSDAYPPAPDAEDARLAAAGDVAAFERLYRRHVARVHTLATRMLGPDDADDATQDVFIRTWERLGQFRGESAFGTWLHRLAINVVLGRRASPAIRRRWQHEGGDAVLELTARPELPDHGLDFEAAVRRLPAGQREVFLLHDVEGYKHEEIAEMLGISPGTSKSQLHRVRMTLRRYLG
jgi:RNA polymerase sigma-70 factor, ECF subfamily